MLKKKLLSGITILACASSMHAAIIAVDSASSIGELSNNLVPANMIHGELATSGDNFSSATFEDLTETNKYNLVSNSEYKWLGGGAGDGTTTAKSQFFMNTRDKNTESVTFNFTDADISEILMWNYSQASNRGTTKITSVAVDFGEGFVDQNITMDLSQAGDVAFKAQSLMFDDTLTGVDAIRLSLENTLTGGGSVGFDEVAFSSVAVPEPSSIALLALAGLGLISRRRR